MKSQYIELQLIEGINCKKTKTELLLLFIVEYARKLENCSQVGLRWGACGSEVKANNEAIKVADHIERLKTKLLELI